MVESLETRSLDLDPGVRRVLCMLRQVRGCNAQLAVVIRHEHGEVGARVRSTPDVDGQAGRQAWIEQKNGSVVRRFVGHERYSGGRSDYGPPVWCDAVVTYCPIPNTQGSL